MGNIDCCHEDRQQKVNKKNLHFCMKCSVASPVNTLKKVFSVYQA